MKSILVLYTELADYILYNFNQYSKENNIRIYIIHWPVNKQAPFKHNNNELVTLIDKSKFSKTELFYTIKNLDFDLIISAGWMDKDYLKIVNSYKNITSIVTMDNHYNASFKQKILGIISPLFLKKLFNYIWIPGSPQYHYAKRLSFKDEQILQDLYIPNFDKLENIDYTFEKTFIYVGRYIEHKGIKDLWQAFIELKSELPNDWKLICIGTGELWNERTKHDDITHLGFLQPEEFNKHISGGVFILPSHFEPWGVVVHEFAYMGFPLILSERVGSASKFLIDNKNGYSFKSKSVKSLKESMRKIILKEVSEISLMSSKSRELGRSSTYINWKEELLKTKN